MTKQLKVAVIGAGPAGIYASDILSKTELDVQIDLFERLPAPYGLVRYGVAPDHPRIKQIIDALYKILERGDIRLLGNVEVGIDISIEELTERYDAVIIATGADRDAPLRIPGTDAPQCFGAADFVSWYDGHPDYPRQWPLSAKDVAVIGVGNVALDVARVLAKDPLDMLKTEVPANVFEGLKDNPATDVHVFGRRGPAQVKFTPLELRELGKVPGVDVIVSEEDFDFDEGSQAALRASKQQQQVVKTLTQYASVDPEKQVAPRRIHIHLFESPVAVLKDEDGNVTGLRTERTELIGDGNVAGTGKMTDWPVQSVYRAVGYYSSQIPGVPFDKDRGVVPNDGGRVLQDTGASQIIPGLYATGWIKRGPVGLIGSTKSDAQETIGNLVADAQADRLHSASGEDDDITQLLEERHVPFTTWEGWELLDAYERELGQQFGSVPGDRGVRERVKVVSRSKMTKISRGELGTAESTEDHVGVPGELDKPAATERFLDYSGPHAD